LPNGKPVHSNFSLSISHTADFAIAVAVANTSSAITIPHPASNSRSVMPLQNLTPLYIIAFSAFLLSLLLLILFILK
jgi:hypothetical protein